MSKFIFASANTFEEWDYRNPSGKGIGGSETAVVELSRRLAKRGHEVKVYAPIPKDCPPLFEKTVWKNYKTLDPSEDGIWIICRSPLLLDYFKKDHPNQKVYLQMQDVKYPMLTDKNAEKIDVMLPLCTTHVESVKRDYPDKKIIMSSNGVKLDVIKKLRKQKRDPFRIMYASSPDRGLVTLLKIFGRIHEKEPRASLHAFYGFDNIQKMVDKSTPIDPIGTTIGQLEKLMQQTNVFWHGRIGQIKLYEEWLKSGVWGYPTRFSETSCIISMEAQSLGAIPVTNPFWALKDNIMYGSRIDGDVHYNFNTRAHYIDEIVYWMNHGDEIRNEMMKKAQTRFDWEKVVDQYETFS